MRHHHYYYHCAVVVVVVVVLVVLVVLILFVSWPDAEHLEAHSRPASQQWPGNLIDKVQFPPWTSPWPSSVAAGPALSSSSAHLIGVVFIQEVSTLMSSQ